MQQRLPKFKRAPDALPNRQLTDTSLAILDLLARYQFLPTSFLVALAPSSKNITHRHLQLLFHRGLVNRFSFPRVGNPGEFQYYLDNPGVIGLLDRSSDMELGAVIRRNREKRYADVHDLSRVEEMQGKLLFLKHEVMISRFHALLELACRASSGRVELERFRQGPALWQKVLVPTLARDGEQRELVETNVKERKVVRPDAFLTLRFPKEPDGANRAHFFYEADRQTESTSRIADKLRIYYTYVVRERLHETHFGVKRVRALLVETLRPDWAATLRHSALQPTISGGKPSPLFWFSHSSALGTISNPAPVLEAVWSAASDDRLHSLTE